VRQLAHQAQDMAASLPGQEVFLHMVSEKQQTDLSLLRLAAMPAARHLGTLALEPASAAESCEPLTSDH